MLARSRWLAINSRIIGRTVSVAPYSSGPRGNAMGKMVTLAGLVLFAGGMGSIPLLVRLNQSKAMISSEDKLTGSQVQRGAFMNSGSKDVGRDHDWNLETRSWEGKRSNN